MPASYSSNAYENNHPLRPDNCQRWKTESKSKNCSSRIHSQLRARPSRKLDSREHFHKSFSRKVSRNLLSLPIYFPGPVCDSFCITCSRFPFVKSVCHAGCKNISKMVMIGCLRGGVENLSIMDNGSGFDPRKRSRPRTRESSRTTEYKRFVSDEAALIFNEICSSSRRLVSKEFQSGNYWLGF